MAQTLEGPVLCRTPPAGILFPMLGMAQITFPLGVSLLLLNTSGDAFCLGPSAPKAGIGCGLGLPEKNTECPVKLEIQADNKSFF